MIKKILQTTSLKANIVANFSGNALMAVLNMVFIPFYLKYIGSEGYGLIGVFASIQSILYLLDSGLSTTINKELAGLSTGWGNRQKIANLVKTLESVYWPMALFVGILAAVVSYFLATGWVQAKTLHPDAILHAFLILSITLVFQFPMGFYAGGMLGLQRHLLYNLLRVSFALLRNIGALLILMFYSNSVIIFFAWNLAITIILVGIFRFTLQRLIKTDGVVASFDRNELKRVSKFSAGMGLIALSAIMMMQADKIILSKKLLLADFGYYTIAVTLGMAVLQIVGPVAQSFFPKFSYLGILDDEDKLKDTFHKCCQLVSIIIFPASLMLIFYTKEVLLLWTHNTATVEKTWLITELFAIGTALNAMVSILFLLTFALNWTKFAFYISFLCACVATPVIVIITWFYGQVGAAACWIGLNALYFIFVPYIVHKKFMKGDLLSWYWKDTLKPLAVCTLFFILVHLLISTSKFTAIQMSFYLTVIGCSALAITATVCDKIKMGIYQIAVKKLNTNNN